MARITVGMTGAQFIDAINNIDASDSYNEKVYNVKYYGAKADGITDDTVAIQTAINACFAAGGGTVYFPNGIYIIAGALNGTVNGVFYNSQIYIPAYTTSDKTNRPTIILRGESVSYLWNFSGYAASYFESSDCGVILKSTIAGTGIRPSVICSNGPNFGWALYNYTDCQIYNIAVVVDAFEDGDGPSMCGINFIGGYSSRIDNVACCVDISNMANSVAPVSHVFGFAIGCVNGEFISIGTLFTSGFYYGTMLGEGVNVNLLCSMHNYIGIHCLHTWYGSTINYAMLHWNTYAIASQQEAFGGKLVVGISDFKFNYVAIERNLVSDPGWEHFVDAILDVDNNLYGTMDYYMSAIGGGDAIGDDITKGSGGTNLLIRNRYKSSMYHWETATRPSDPGMGCMGYNTTTNKLEAWNGTQWSDLF